MVKQIETIAEFSWCHMGDMNLAAQMIVAAKDAGADYAKFQTWKVSRLIPGPWDTDGRRQIYEKAELSDEDHYYLKSVCDDTGIKFLTSCFCADDLDFVRTLTNEVKIPSPEASNKALIQGAVDKFDRVLLSTGASTPEEFIQWEDNDNIFFMHCISSYPCEPENFHMQKLNFIKHCQQNLVKPYGFSGHYPGIWDAILAITQGATIIEKHLTIDHDLPGRDNKFALLPEEFSQITNFISYFEITKEGFVSVAKILPCEEDYRKYHKGRWGG